ncbi:sugar transferase [Candidatus Peregrinibacteria bacterium]|nr:sugar transferase [Candidatus Peregrinibacteria bacterium]
MALIISLSKTMLDKFFFIQERVGRNGAPIAIWKLRTMNGAVNRDLGVVDGRLAEAIPEQDRISFIGALLRHLGIDEIPQILNLIRGEMQLVGLRPIPSEEIDLFPPDIRAFYLRNLPGLFPGHLAFGYVNGNLEKKIELIREYMSRTDDFKKLRNLLILLTKIYLRKLTHRVSIELIRGKIAAAMRDVCG